MWVMDSDERESERSITRREVRKMYKSSEGGAEVPQTFVTIFVLQGRDLSL